MRRQLHVQVVDTPAVLHSCQESGGKLAIEVDVATATAASATHLILTWPKAAATQRFAATATRLDARTLRLRGAVPVAAARGPGQPADRAAADSAAQAAAGPAVEWELHVEADSRGPVRVAFPAAVPEFRRPLGTREIGVERSSDGNVIIVGRERPAGDRAARLERGRRLTLTGSFPAAMRAATTPLLRRRGSTDQHLIGFSRDGDRFTIEITAAGMPSFGRLLPLRDGFWDILVRRADAADRQLIVPSYDHGRLDRRSMTRGSSSGRRATGSPPRLRHADPYRWRRAQAR